MNEVFNLFGNVRDPKSDTCEENVIRIIGLIQKIIYKGSDKGGEISKYPITLSSDIRSKELIIIANWIGTIREGEKLNTKGFKISSNDFSTNFKRWCKGDNREDDLEFIHYIVNKMIQLLDISMRKLISFKNFVSESLAFNGEVGEKNLRGLEVKKIDRGEIKCLGKGLETKEMETECQNLINSLNYLINGVINLKKSYHDDRVFISMIDDLIDSTILSKFENIKVILPKFFVNIGTFRYQRVNSGLETKQTAIIENKEEMHTPILAPHPETKLLTKDSSSILTSSSKDLILETEDTDINEIVTKKDDEEIGNEDQ